MCVSGWNVWDGAGCAERRGIGRAGRRTFSRARGLGWEGGLVEWAVSGFCFGLWRVKGRGGEVPLLDFVEAGEEGNGDEDHDCFFAVADFELGEG